MAKRRSTRKPKTGRPPEFVRNPERVEALLDLISKGSSLTLACRLTGLSKSTVIGWNKKSKEARASKYFVDFSNRLKKARADFFAYHLGNIKRAAETQWQASAWSLERAEPEYYANPVAQLQLREFDRQLREVQKTIETNRQGCVGNGATWQASRERIDGAALHAVVDSSLLFKCRSRAGEPFKEGSHRLLKDLDTARDVLGRPEYAAAVLREWPPPEGETHEDFLARVRVAIEALGPWERAARAAVESIKLRADG